MKILYQPEIINGEQAQGDTLCKYGVDFVKNEITEVTDTELAEKMLTCPYFFEQGAQNDSPSVEPAPRKKRKYTRRKVENGDESPNS